MVKAITISFDVDTDTGEVTNVKAHVEGEVKKKTTTKKKKEVIEELENTPLIIREDGKLIFNNKAIDEMGLTSESRVIVEYEKDKGKLFPVIGTDVSFDTIGAGNKLTKSKTVSFRGNQNTVLGEFGDEFTIQKYRDGVWKLVSNSKVAETVEEAIELSDEVDAQLLVDDDETYEIDELEFKL